MSIKYERKNVMLSKANKEWLENMAVELDRTQSDMLDEAIYNYKHAIANRIRRAKDNE